MRKTLFIVTLSALFLGTAGWAQETTPQDATSAIQAEATDVTRGYLKNELLGFKPQLGLMLFDETASGDTTSRFAVGFTIDANIATAINPNWSSIYFGPSTGFIYSHTGDPTSNFFGTNAATQIGNAGANLFFIPADLRLGYNVSDNFRIGAHGGGNVLYRSVASSINLGDSSSVPGSVWRIFPNVGADVEFALGKSVAVGLRPDWTITPGNDIFTGTLALNFLLG